MWAYTVRWACGRPEGGHAGHQDDGLQRSHAGFVPAMAPVGSMFDLASILGVLTACVTFGSAAEKLLAHTV